MIPEPPILLPTPQKFKFTGRQTSFPVTSDRVIEKIENSAGFGDEAYILNIHTDRVTIEGTTQKAVRYGHDTLNQLIYQYGQILPTLEIIDFPNYPNRGVMLDISRDRVPTMEHLFETIDLLASWKVNHLQLYTEHTFAYKGHETVWKDASPMTAEEIRQIDNYCVERDINLTANQNCFGHMTRWLKHDKYAHLAETIDGWHWGGLFRPEPFSLCPIDPRSIELIDDLLGKLLPKFGNKLVNIGCDETIDVGQGRSKESIAKLGFPAVYFDFVDKILDIVRRHGFRPMIWADMVLNHPESIERLSEDVIALAWGYEPDLPFGEWCKSLCNVIKDVWVCPGTSSWRSITGRTTERHLNICESAIQGKQNGASGFMVTDWGDLGHRQQYPIALHGLAEGANAAWNVSSAEQYDSRASSLHVFGDKAGKVGEWLDRLGDIDLELRRSPVMLKNSSALFVDLHKPFDDLSDGWSVSDWLSLSDKLDDLTSDFPDGITNQVADELKHTLYVARFAVERAILRRELDSRRRGNDEKMNNADLKNKIQIIIKEHRRLWLLRSRPGGLDDSCRYYEEINMV